MNHDLPDWWPRVPLWAQPAFKAHSMDGWALHGKAGHYDGWIGWRPGSPHGMDHDTACLHGDFTADELRSLAAMMEPGCLLLTSNEVRALQTVRTAARVALKMDVVHRAVVGRVASAVATVDALIATAGPLPPEPPSATFWLGADGDA